MLVGAAIGTVAHCRVSIGNELVVIGAEGLPSLFRALVQDDDHEGSHEERRITLLVIVQARVVVDLIVFVLLVVH